MGTLAEAAPVGFKAYKNSKLPGATDAPSLPIHSTNGLLTVPPLGMVCPHAKPLPLVCERKPYKVCAAPVTCPCDSHWSFEPKPTAPPLGKAPAK